MRRLENKVAIITGAGQGLGQATAQLFASEGAYVVVSDINQKTAEATAGDIVADGGQAIAIRMDVAKAVDAERLAKTTVDHYGRIDILVNNAGIINRGNILYLSEEEWDTMLDVNLKGVFLCSKYVVPYMQQQGGGSIVCISSISGVIAQGDQAGYNASKHGVIGLARCMAQDCAKDNIRVNVVCPGMMNTPMLASEPEEDLAKYRANNMMNRASEPVEVARTVLHLASDEASFTTGAILVVDGGETAH